MDGQFSHRITLISSFEKDAAVNLLMSRGVKNLSQMELVTTKVKLRLLYQENNMASTGMLKDSLLETKYLVCNLLLIKHCQFSGALMDNVCADFQLNTLSLLDNHKFKIKTFMQLEILDLVKFTQHLWIHLSTWVFQL
jgi:hypothetical protein